MVGIKQRRYIVISLVLMCTVGCSSMTGSNHQSTADASKERYQAWEYTQVGATQVNTLTELVAIPQLTELVNKAMKNNASLQQVAGTLRIAYAQRGVVAGDYRPLLSAGFEANDQEDSAESYSANLSVSWELDLWQKISNNVTAAEMDIASSEATYQAARDALAASTMRAWLQINLRQQLIAIEAQRLVVLESNEKTILERYRAGLEALEALDTARSNSASSRATLAEYHEQLQQSKRSLWLLLGGKEQGLAVNITQAFPAVLQPLAGFPAQDLGRRPDLRSAYYDIIANQHRVDVAYKALLPSINLSASLTDIASSPSEALLTDPVWHLLGQLTAPLYQGGKLRSQAKIAEITAEQSFWAYQETLLNAVNEVENALGQEKSLGKQQQNLNDALASARRSFSHYQIKYRQGLVSILDLLSVQQQTFDLESRLTQVTYSQLVNRIDLGLALGLGVSS